MKKMFVIVACSLFSCLNLYALVPEEHPVRKIKVVNVEKKDGRRSFLGIFGEVKYNYVKSHSSVEYVTNPVTGRQDEIFTTTITCEGPGGESCRRSGAISIMESAANGSSVADDFMDTIVNLLLDQIDDRILSNKEYNGSINKMYMFVSPENNKPMYFNASAVWFDANENADAKITIKIYDVTNEMSRLLH